MSWNHRVVKRMIKGLNEEVPSFGIHEAFYDKNGRVWGITQEPMDPHGETIEELRQDLEWMMKALEHPVLDYDAIPEEGAKGPGDSIDPKDFVPWE